MSLSRLGPHGIRSTPDALAWARVAPIVKSIDNVDLLRAAPDASIRIWRHYLPHQRTADPAGTVGQIVASLAGYHHENLYVESWNEAHPTLDELKTAVSGLHFYGYKAAGGSFGTGDYTQTDWDIVRASGADAISVHCYWGERGFTLDHALRYRQFWRAGDRPVLILECGRDAVEGGGAGWQLSKVTATQYIDELVAYNAEIGKDRYVLGATPFTSGPTPDWAAFDVDPLTTALISQLGKSPPGGNVITSAELERLISNAYQRANVPYNPASAFAKYFTAQLRAGHYLGAPEEPEHPSEDGTLLLQRFAGAYLWCRKSDFIVQAGPFPFA